MGNGGSSISDIFFQDNPNRRRRAEELRAQIYAMQVEIQNLSNQKDQILGRIRTRLDKVLKERGFQNTEELEKAVQASLSSKELEKYNELRARIEKGGQAEGIMWDIIGIVGFGSGVVIGGLVMLGIVSGPAGWAALSAVGAILAAVSVIVIVGSIVEGYRQRDELRGAIHNLWFKRAEIKQYVERMRAITNWATAIEIWLNDPVTDNPEHLNQLLSRTLDEEYNKWTMQHVDSVLAEQDRRNNSWTNEDPKRSFSALQFMDGRIHEKVAVTEFEDNHPGTAEGEFVIVPSGSTQDETKLGPWRTKIKYVRSESLTSCLVSIGERMWRMQAIPFSLSMVALDTVLFNFYELEADRGADAVPKVLGNGGIQLSGCQVQMVRI